MMLMTMMKRKSVKLLIYPKVKIKKKKILMIIMLMRPIVKKINIKFNKKGNNVRNLRWIKNQWISLK